MAEHARRLDVMANAASRKFLAFLLVLIIPVILFLIFEFKKRETGLRIEKLPVLSQQSIPHFQLTTNTGESISRKDLSGKIVVSDFIFTRCSGICSRMSSQMMRVQKWIKNNQNLKSEVLLLSHTVDPKNDTPETLAEYAGAYNADPKMWFFLTGERNELYNLSINFYKLTALETPEDTANLFAHSEKFILLDKQGFIRGYYDGTDSASVKQLFQDIVNLDIHYQLSRKEQKKS